MDESRLTPAQHRDLVQRLFLERVSELRRFVTATVPDMALVDDVIADTFKAATVDAAFYDPTQSFTAWMQPFVNRAISRSGTRTNAASQPLGEEVLDILAGSRPDGLASDVRQKLLDECVEKLAPQTRKIIDLRYRKAMKPREVAKLIGWTAASVHVALSRARSALRECIDGKIEGLQQGRAEASP